MSIGETLGSRFRVIRLAGHGGMGTVYEAIDSERDARVAVKLPRYTGDREHLRRLARESRALAECLTELRHPGIVEYVAHGATDDGRPYLVMEWLDGCDLGDRIHSAPLTADETVLVARQVCSALASLRRRSIIHRDIKPSDLFLVDRDIARVKLLDLGVARIDRAQGPDGLIGDKLTTLTGSGAKRCPRPRAAGVFSPWRARTRAPSNSRRNG